LGLGLCVLLTGCATGSKVEAPPARAMPDAQAPVFSVEDNRDTFTVSVSPARQTLQIAGTWGLVAGASISAIADDKYRQEIRDVLGDYDPGAHYEQRLQERLSEVLGDSLRQIPLMQQPVGNATLRETVTEYWSKLRDDGADLLLELEITYGLFGPRATVVTRLDCELIDLTKGDEVWQTAVYAFSDPILASTPLRNPSNRVKPNFGSPKLRSEGDALARWTKSGDDSLRREFEGCVEGAIAALLTALDVEASADGAYRLGTMALVRRDLETAKGRLNAALALKPEFLDARMALAVAQAHDGDVDGAIAATTALTEEHPDYAAAWYNVAWWTLKEKNDAVAAGPYYVRAKALDMPTIKALEPEE
jgi:tetratricopeptide (TPR) repeat protein